MRKYFARTNIHDITGSYLWSHLLCPHDGVEWHLHHLGLLHVVLGLGHQVVVAARGVVVGQEGRVVPIIIIINGSENTFQIIYHHPGFALSSHSYHVKG